MKEFSPGYVLDNRGIVLEQKDDVVLCLLPHNQVTPFVTWVVNDEGDAYHGNYFRTLEGGLDDFKFRSR